MSEEQELCLPAGMTDESQLYKTVFVDTSDLEVGRLDAESRRRLDEALCRALEMVHPEPVSGQCVLKVHVGEPKNDTSLMPTQIGGAVRFLKQKGAAGIVAGDTTVVYNGPRNHKRNPIGGVSDYLELARSRGWSVEGEAGLPFVVLDRPSTAVKGQFEFDTPMKRTYVKGVRRFGNFYLPGGFDAADLVLNHAHMTFHGLADLAGCVKGVGMGCTTAEGKLRLHCCFFPHVDADKCEACGVCVENCPEEALSQKKDDAPPVLDKEGCIGCAECEAVCPQDAIEMKVQEVDSWSRGTGTLSERMADYVVGLMNGKWETTIQVLHMWTITEMCDCMNTKQSPMLEKDIGILVGKNPFAVDAAAAKLFGAQWQLEKSSGATPPPWRRGLETEQYVKETYGIISGPVVKTIKA